MSSLENTVGASSIPDIDCQVLSAVNENVPHSLLATARMRVKNGRSQFDEIRVICDSGAQVNLLSEDAFNRLWIARTANRCNIIGVGGSAVVTMGRVTLELWHHTRDEIIDSMTFTIIEGLSMCHPQKSFRPIEFDHINRDELADDKFNENAPVDGIIGVSVLSQHLGPYVQKASSSLMTQSSSFGWIVFGGLEPDEAVDMLATVGAVTISDVYSMIKRLWEVDELPDEGPSKSPLEIECESLYESTLERQEGRYAVTLLIKPGEELGESRAMAERRLHSLERRFQKDPALREKYIEFMREYERMGHMQKADPLASSNMHYYIPHHAVAIDRKFRVVFDASATTTNGKSLNDIQYVGPRLQADLVDILMKFRTGRVAMSADIAKMFRQICVQRSHWDLQRILWRESTTEPITEFWLTVVTYGMASSPFNAVKTLQQCAIDNSAKYTEAAATVLHDFYVDDLLTSMDTESRAVKLKADISALLTLGGFPLTKWCSNYSAVMNVDGEVKPLTEQDSTSALGMMWNYRTDEFQFQVHSRPQPEVLTRRIVTSEAGRVFDPQGYLAPITVRAKCFIQGLWGVIHTGDKKLRPAWDGPITPQLQSEWRAYYNELREIEQFRIPRWIGTSAETTNQIHIFCDASMKAYGAAAYVRVKIDGDWSAKLLCSRSKVAPTKTMTIPRLELCAMDLGRKLLTKVKGMEMFCDSPAFMWTDSEIVLHWLRKPGTELKTFVANRVKKILGVITLDQAMHVCSEQNPADLISRGTHVSTLHGNALWWNGPELLQQATDVWPPWQPNHNTHTMEIVGSETKSPPVRFDNVLLTTRVDVDTDSEISLIDRWSSYRKACRITAYVFRFCHLTCQRVAAKRLAAGNQLRVPTSYGLTEYAKNKWMSESYDVITCHTVQFRIRVPSISETRCALKYWAMMSQRETYPEEVAAVIAGKSVDRRSTLFMLTPRMNDDHLLRICGRLGNADLPYEVRHPMILSRQSTLAKRLADEAHQILGHTGVQTCTQYLRHKIWIVGIRVLLRTLIRKCVVCTRYREQMEQQFMADIPARRLEAAPAFEYTGVDYAGPMTLKLTRNTTTKAWIAVFVCMRYKAVHLELVSGLDTSAFLAALQRFVNLRGGCVKHMHSDRGTNFVGAARELREAAESWQDHQVAEYLSMNAIEWHNITPFAPHHGGLWESMVKIVKTHLKKMAGAHMFTFEELATLLTKIGAIINSRPLTPLSTDPSDLTAVTPSHFLSTRPIVSPLEPELSNVALNRLTAWQRIARIQQDFANRWRNEYFSELQRRNKWAGTYRSMRVGDLVLIRSDNAPASRWPMARVIEVFTGPDGRVRSCRLKTETAEIERPITKLCLLPIDSDEEDASETGFCPKNNGFSQSP